MDICTVKPWFEVLVAVFALISAVFWFAAPRYNAIAASCAGLAALLQIAVLFMPVCRAFAQINNSTHYASIALAPRLALDASDG